MLSFGEKLRRERESRNTDLEEMARATKIQSCYLEALERNEFDALPGRAFGKLYIRAYADVLGFDPRPLIAAYDREHQSQARKALEEEAAEAARDVPAEVADEEAAEVPPEAPVEVPVEEVAEEPPEEPIETPVEEATETPPEAAVEAVQEEPAEVPREEPAGTLEDRHFEAPRQEAVVPGSEATHDDTPRTASEGKRTAVVAALLLVGLLALTVWVYFAFFRTGAAESEPPADALPSRVEAGEEPAETPARQEPPVEAGAEIPPPEPAGAALTSSARLSVPEFGVGRRVVNHRLEGRGRRFEEGTVVWFWTLVLGGGPGEKIRHVWLHEGRPVESTELELGGPHWRTHSRKTLRGVGQWSVEVRDSEARVLAKSTFTCAPAGS